MIEIISNRSRKGRKKYKCDLCRGEINIGDTYNCCTYKDGEKIYTSRTHRKCIELVEELGMRDLLDYEYTDYDFEEAVYLALDESPKSEVLEEQVDELIALWKGEQS